MEIKQIQLQVWLFFQMEMRKDDGGKRAEYKWISYLHPPEAPYWKKCVLKTEHLILQTSHEIIWSKLWQLPRFICMHWIAHASSPQGTIVEWEEVRYFPPQTPSTTSTAWAQNVPPRLNLIITAANTMALNSSSRFFEGCRLHRHHNPLHLAHSLTHSKADRKDKTKWRRREGWCRIGGMNWVLTLCGTLSY